jgi:8-oxo-dGTP pyrophosphatase MutT (NUDIX family)
MKIKPKIVFKTKYQQDKVDIKHIPSRRKINQEIENLSKLEWSKLLEEAQEQNKLAWDSELYRLEKVQEKEGRVLLTLSTVPFSIVKGMDKFIQQVNTLGEKYYSKSIYTKAVILTTDQKYIIGKVSKKTLNKHEYNLIGGVLSKSESEVNSGKDLFNSLLREIEEELGLTNKEILKTVLIGATLSTRLKIGLIFLVTLNLNSEELQKKVKLDKSEIVNYQLLNKKQFYNFLNSENVNNKIILDLL